MVQPSLEYVIGSSLVGFLQLLFHFALLLTYVEMAKVKETYGKATVNALTRRISGKLQPVVGILAPLSAISFAVGNATSLSYLRWISAVVFAMTVSCVFFVLSNRGLSDYAFVIALLTPSIAVAIIPSRGVLDTTLSSTLPMLLNLLLVRRLTHSEIRMMKLPKIKEAISTGLRFRIPGIAVFAVVFDMFLYLGVFIPRYYRLQTTEDVLVTTQAILFCAIYYLISSKSVISATMSFYFYFGFILRCFWNIDPLLILPLFFILSVPLLTMRRVETGSKTPTQEVKLKRKPRKSERRIAHSLLNRFIGRRERVQESKVTVTEDWIRDLSSYRICGNKPNQVLPRSLGTS